MKCTVIVVLLSLVLGGCATTYIPISRNYRARAQELTRSDVTLSVLFNRFDPKRQTLDSGESFSEVMWPSEVPHHLGAYRTDTGLIYTNLYLDYTDRQLRELLKHELAHHIWFRHMSEAQRELWNTYLEVNPTSLHDMVRQMYLHPEDHQPEDFAFTMQHARSEDLKLLVQLNLLNPDECEKLIADTKRNEPKRDEKEVPRLSMSTPAPDQATP